MTRYRIALHNHSTWSYDGTWDLARIAKVFGRLGFDAVMMSEHDTGFDPASFPDYRAACAEASSAGALLIPGIEYSSPDNRVHLPTWGLESFLAEHRPIDETLKQIQTAGGAAIFAHPIRKAAWQVFDPAWVPMLCGLELWNRKSDGIAPGQEAIQLLAKTGLAPTVGCDFHRAKQLYPLSMRFSSEEPLSEAMLVEALKTRALTPHAFGRPLLATDGTPRPTPVFNRLEGVRKTLARTLRGRKG